jgi:hypothetical protein
MIYEYLFRAEFDIFWVPFNEYIKKFNEEYYANKWTRMKGLAKERSLSSLKSHLMSNNM